MVGEAVVAIVVDGSMFVVVYIMMTVVAVGSRAPKTRRSRDELTDGQNSIVWLQIIRIW